MKKLLTNLIFFSILFQLFFIVPAAAQAVNLKDAFGKPLEESAGLMGYDTKNQGSLESVAGSIISAFLSILGVIFIGFIIYAGYTWLTSRGEADKVNTAKSILRTSIIGLIIILAAYAISIFVLSQLGGETLTGVTGQ